MGPWPEPVCMMAAGLFTLRPPVAQDKRVVYRWILENPPIILPGSPGSKTGCLNQQFPFFLIKSMPLFIGVHVCVYMHLYTRELMWCVYAHHHSIRVKSKERAHSGWVGSDAFTHWATAPMIFSFPYKTLFLSIFPVTPHITTRVEWKSWGEYVEHFILLLSYHGSLFIRPELSCNALPVICVPVLYLKCTTCPVKITSCSCATTVAGLWSPCQSAFYTQSWLPDPNPLLPSPSSHSLCSMYHLLSHTFVAGSCWAKQQFAVIYAA